MDREFDKADFSLLPAHIITQILQYLKLDDFKNASSICKWWYYASIDPQIVKTRTLHPNEENFADICMSNHKYGGLKLQNLEFDKMDSHYFELFEKFCPFIHELHIIDSDLKIHHLLKLLEFSTGLEVFSFSGCYWLAQLPGLFPLDYDCEAKNIIVQNLCGIKNIAIKRVLSHNIPLIVDLVRCATNLDTFEFSNIMSEEHAFDENANKHFFTIFDNYDACNLKHLNWKWYYGVNAYHFITNFIQINNFNVKSFKIVIWWFWEDGIYKSSLFHQFILKLQSVVELSIDGLRHDQLSLLCQHLIKLKSLECFLRADDQPISQLGNLKQLEILRCRLKDYTKISFVEIDNFFQYKFEYLQKFRFEGFVTESNLLQFCENHPNLIELSLNRLLTRNLEIIFKHLTKLRVLIIYFNIARLGPEIQNITNREYEYKITRLQDLETFRSNEVVNGIREDDVRQLKKLRSTNLPHLFAKRSVC